MSDLRTARLADGALIVDCEHKTAPLVDAGDLCSIRTADILNGRIDFNSANRVSEATYRDWTKREVPVEGDIILAREAPVGEVGRIPKNRRVCLGQRTVLIRAHDDALDSRYLCYLLANPEIKADLISRSRGSVVEHLNVEDIRNFEITYPSLPEQRAIAGVLSSLDDKIDLLHRQNNTLEGMAEALWQKTLSDASDSRIIRLGEIIDIRDSERVPLSSIERESMKDGGLYPYYGAATIMDHINRYIFDGEFLLLGEDGTVETDDGYPVLQLATGKFWVNNHAHVLQAKKPFSNFLLYVILKNTSISYIVTGAVQPKTNQQNLKSLEISSVRDATIDGLSLVVDGFWQKIQANNLQLLTLSRLRDTLLPKLMSGEVTVRL